MNTELVECTSDDSCQQSMKNLHNWLKIKESISIIILMVHVVYRMFCIKPEVKDERVPSLTRQVCCHPIRLLRVVVVGDTLKLSKEYYKYSYSHTKYVPIAI